MMSFPRRRESSLKDYLLDPRFREDDNYQKQKPAFWRIFVLSADDFIKSKADDFQSFLISQEKKSKTISSFS